MAALIASALLYIFLMKAVLDRLGIPFAEPLAFFLGFVPFFTLLLRVAKRHS